MKGGGDDAAKLHVLESVLVVCLMVSGVAFVSGLDPAGSSLNPIDRLVTDKARNELAVLADLPARPGAACGAKSKLDDLVLEGVRGQHGTWERWKAEAWGDAYDAELLLQNRDGMMRLHGTNSVGSTAKITWAPEQTFSLPLTNVASTSGAESLQLSAPLVAWSSQARLRGEALRVEATLSSLAENAPVVWAPTALLSDTLENEARAGAGTVVWLVEGKFTLATKADDEHLRPVAADPINLHIQLTEVPEADGEPSAIPIGTSLTIEFPRGWSETSFSSTSGSWVDESDPATPLTLRAVVRDTPSPAETLTITAYAPPEPAHPFDVIKASLGHGSLGESSLVVTYPVPTPERALPRTLHPTVPYPLRLGQSTVFGVALANGGDTVVVKRIEMRVPGGYDLHHNDGLGSAMFVEDGIDLGVSYPSSGWRVEDVLPEGAESLHEPAGRVLAWTSSTGIEVAAGEAHHWVVGVRVTTNASRATSVELPTSDGPNATFTFENGHEVTTRSWGRAPGVPSVRALPATRAMDDPLGGTSDGYAWSTSGVSHEVLVTSRSPLTGLVNSTRYAMRAAGDLTNLDTAIANASLEVTTRHARVGTLVRAEGDFSNAITMLAEAGITPTLALDLYTPTSLGCAPTRSWSLSTASLPHAAARHVLLWDVGAATSVFAATEDAWVHRLAPSGTPLWSARTAGVPSAMHAVESAAWGSHLILGSTTGDVQRLDPMTGIVTWTRSLFAAGVAVLAFEEGTGRILAASDDGSLVFLDLDGEPGAVGSVGAAPIDMIASGDAIHVLDASALHVLTPALDHLKSYPVSAVGFAVAGTEAWVATTTKVHRLDRLTLLDVGTVPLPVEARLATRGDATGDGVEDLVIAHADSSVRVLSGADLMDTRSWPPSVAIEVYAGPPDSDVPNLQAFHSVAAKCDAGPFAHYYAPLSCGGGSLGAGPLRLVAGAGSVALAYATMGDAYLEHFDAAGGSLFLSRLPPDQRPASLHIGHWIASPRAVAYGGADGLVAVYQEQEAPVLESTPGSRVGRFTFVFHVPEGGFYGTSLLIARLTLPDTTQEGRILDWFEVTSADGEEQGNVAYHVNLAVSERSKS